MKKKLAIVVQRYGLEVNGGAEYHARVLAEELSRNYAVEILTTTALDYHIWENHFPEGETQVNGISVHRFPTTNLRSRKFRVGRRAVFKEKKYFKLLKNIGLYNYFDRRFNISKPKQEEIDNWIVGQGPYCPDLLTYISEHGDDFDVFVFFTYLYYPTVKGMPLVADKSIFIPTAHHEPPLFTDAFKNLFEVPKFIMYNTDSEKRLVEGFFNRYTVNNDIAGVGIRRYTGTPHDIPSTLIKKKYFIYIGRIDKGKACDELLTYYIKFQEENPEYRDVKMVLVGKDYLYQRFDHPSIMYTGFVSEELKYALLKNSLAMIMPSYFESLSMVTLEAMIEEIPVIVNEHCEVLHEHILKSETGCSYDSYKGFCAALVTYLKKSVVQLQEEGIGARHYV